MWPRRDACHAGARTRWCFGSADGSAYGMSRHVQMPAVDTGRSAVMICDDVRMERSSGATDNGSAIS